ncbi:methyltransferase family protein, partial [Streptomyces sp. 900116325]
MTTVSTTPTTPITPITPHPGMRLREIVFGAACAAAVRAAARLGVADALGETPAGAEQLAAELSVEPMPLKRLLRALSCYGIFAETEDGKFVHTDLRDTPSGRLESGARRGARPKRPNLTQRAG